MDASLCRIFQHPDIDIQPDFGYKLRKKISFSFTNMYLTLNGGFEMFEVGAKRVIHSLQNVKNKLIRSNAAIETETSGSENEAKSMFGKVCIVTGGNAGLGFTTATELVKRGAHVILACRSLERGEEAKSAIDNKLQNFPSKGMVEVDYLNLSSFESVKKFADHIKNKNKIIDVLINNAGIMAPSNRILTKNGFESQFQVNYLSHFFLTQYLLPKFSNSNSNSNSGDRMKIINITSIMHYGGKINNDDINFDHVYDPLSAYAQSKLALVLMAKELQKRRSDITSVSVHPGIIDTELARGFFDGFLPNFLKSLLKKSISFCLLTPQEALKSVLYAIDEDPRIVSSKYVADGKVKPSSRLSCDEKLASTLWNDSMTVFNEFNSKFD